MNIIEVKLVTGEVIWIEDEASHELIARRLSENGYWVTTKYNDAFGAITRTPFSITERAVLFLTPRAA